MSNALTILTKDSSIAEWMNFDLLRNEGIRHIAKLSGDVWTDHNLHDPGITILEVLCYALTDLGYRNSLSIEDLLARDPNTFASPNDNFFSAAQLLTCNPLTVNDFRKMLMNIEGVRNAWLEAAKGEETLLPRTLNAATGTCTNVRLEGLYNVILELDAFADGKTLSEQDGKVDRILDEAASLLHSHRNLCEDFLDIYTLRDEEIGIRADLEISPDADPDQVMLEVLLRLQEFLSPKITYYTLEEMLRKGKTIEEIFLGRPFVASDSPSGKVLGQSPNYGFIDTAELDAIRRKTVLHASDFYREMMQVPGVRAVRSLRIANFTGGLQQTSGKEWCLHLTPRHRPVMSAWESEFHFYKNNLSFAADKQKVAQRFRERLSGLAKTLKLDKFIDSAIPPGEYRGAELGDFRSIQHEFPLLYRIGEGEMPENAPLPLVVKKQQLKGYLLFFDQLLANYLAQLSHLRSLFNLGIPASNGNGVPPSSTLVTQYSQPLADVPELDTLIRYFQTSSDFFKEGETVAQALENERYPTPEQRDMAVSRLIADFEAGNMVMHIEQEVGNLHRFYGSGTSPQRRVFRSKTLFDSYQDAGKVAEQLNFLGTLKACYKSIRLADGSDKPYTFELIYQPVAYADYLRQITEKPEVAEDRRTRLLNHLLGRFAEEFTEYTLLMYAVEGKKRDEKKIIQDKEAFLRNYPAISRDRGRAFNYLFPHGGTNISGMEHRVAGLLGMEGQTGKPLTHLEITKWELLHRMEVRNGWGELLFRGSPKAADMAVEELRIRALAKDPANYQVEECKSTHVFTFRLEEGGGIVARHPQTYPTKQRAEAKIQCLANLATAEQGWLLKATPRAASGWFTLLDAAGNPLLESVQTYPDLKSTRDAWIRLVQLFDQVLNESPCPSPLKHFDDEKTRNFSFFFSGSDYGERLAHAVHSFGSRKKRTDAVESLKTYLGSKKLRPSIRTLAAAYSWQLHEQGKERKPLLTSLLRFQSEDLALANRDWFRAMAVYKKNWHDLYDERTGMYAFFVREKDGYSAAQSPWFKSNEQRHAAKTKARILLGRARVVTQTQAVENAGKTVSLSTCFEETPEVYFKVNVQPERYSFTLNDENGEALLTGARSFETEAEAQWAFYAFTQKGADPASYRVLREENACRYTIVVPTPDCGDEATHPHWYHSKAEAQAAIVHLAAYLAANALPFTLDYREKTWRPEIHWENAEGNCVPLLSGEWAYEQQAGALDAAKDWESRLMTAFGSLEPHKTDGFFSFRLVSEGKVLVSHPAKYAEAPVRDKMLAAARAIFQGAGTWDYAPAETWSKPSDQPANEALRYGFRVMEPGSTVAVHPAVYSKSEKRDKLLLELKLHGKNGTLPYSSILSAEESAVQVGSVWHFDIQDKDNVWWRSHASFYSKEEAVQGFNSQFRTLLELAENPCQYKPERQTACHWLLHLKNKDGETVATSPDKFSSEEAVYCKINELVGLAKTYPFVREGASWRYRILKVEKEEDHVLWQSSAALPSLEAAQKAFGHFLHLATYSGNYFKKDEAEAGRFEIVLQEALLESSLRFNTQKAAWRQAEAFALLADQKEAYFSFLSPDAPCRYGFRVAEEGYLLARHSRRYHTPEERDERLHRLYAESQRNVTGRSSISTTFERVSNQFFAIISDENYADKVLWRSATGFPVGPASDPEKIIRRYYQDGEQPLPAYQNYFLDLYEYARHPAFYVVIQEGDDRFRLGLNNPDARLELLSEQTTLTEEACRALATDMIRLFRRFPVLKEDGSYLFQYCSFDEDWAGEQEETENNFVLSGKILWESADAFPAWGDALSAFDQFHLLFKDKTNYHRSEENDRSYFSIEITDPAKAMAEHPLTYGSPDDVKAALEKTLSMFNIEGFYLVEHLLLRPDPFRLPRCEPLTSASFTDPANLSPCAGQEGIGLLKPESAQEPCKVYIAQRCSTDDEGNPLSCLPFPLHAQAAGDPCETKTETPKTGYLLPYADAYSFQMTAVLPYWPRRFQNADFRKFFENTLRRETPAHLLLNILWVGPEQMRAFEAQYRSWLVARSLEGDCLRNCSQDSFAKLLLEGIRQGNPPPKLDAFDPVNGIELDRTRLSV